jgi:hypothetical protein
MIVQPASIGPRSKPRRVLRIAGVVLPVVLLAAVVVIGVAGPAPAPPRESASTVPAVAVVDVSAAPSPTATPEPAPVIFPGSIAGLDVHGVRWTVEARNRGLARGLIAVAGYLGMASVPDDCMDARLGIFGSFCERVAFLTEQPMFGVADAQPDAPGFHLNPQFLPGVRMPSQATFVAVSPSTATPATIVLGRFGDDRAEPCVPGGRHCGQEFVVERVAWVDGADYPTTTTTVDPAASTAGLTESDLSREASLARAALGPGAFWLMDALMLPPTIERLEPAADAAAASLDPSTPVWFVRGMHALGDPNQIDWLIVDATGERVLVRGFVRTSRLPTAATRD